MRKTFLLIVILIAFQAISAQTATTLSQQQIDSLKQLKAKTEQQAAPYAMKLAATAKQIYANMLSDKEDQKLRAKLSKELHFNAGKLLDITGQSFRDTLALLTPEQKKTIREALAKPDAPTDIGELIEKTFGLKDK